MGWNGQCIDSQCPFGQNAREAGETERITLRNAVGGEGRKGRVRREIVWVGERQRGKRKGVEAVAGGAVARKIEMCLI